MNRAAVDLLIQRLPNGLVHPGNPETGEKAQPLPLPGLSSTGIPKEMAQHFAEEAGLPSADATKLLAEAIVHLLESEIYGPEREQLQQQAAAAPDGTRVIAFHAACDRTKAKPLIEVTVPKTTDRAVIPCRAIKALFGRNPDCPHESR